MARAIIEVEGLGKKYLLGLQQEGRPQYQSVRETLVNGMRSMGRRLRRPFDRADRQTRTDFWALRDVSFAVQPGEVVGIIGRNGAGKSTLLKVLSRITEPTTGEITLRGRVASLLEVGTGFHPELTGRENVYLNGTILGMSRAEIRKKFDEIVAFAEVEKFLDTPVKRYSSGMYMRLAFAVAAHLEPEILIVDEVLAVGDAQFQQKCLGKMGEVANAGRTVLFVSHNMAAIRQLTKQCIYLHAGRVVDTGKTALVADRYRDNSVIAKSESRESLAYYRRGNTVPSSIRFRTLRFLNRDGQEAVTLQPGDSFRLETTIEANESHVRACLVFCITNERGERASTFFSGDTNFWFRIAPGVQTVRCDVIGLPLSPGRYTATVGVNRTATTLAYDVLMDYPAFDVVLSELESGAVDWSNRTWGCVHWTDVAWDRS